MARKRKRPDDFDMLGYVDSFDFVPLEEKPRLFAAMSDAWRRVTGKWPGMIPVLEYRAMVRHRLRRRGWKGNERGKR